MRTRTKSHIHTQHTRTYARKRTHTHSHTLTHTQAYINTNTHTNTYTHTHAHTQTLTNTHTHKRTNVKIRRARTHCTQPPNHTRTHRCTRGRIDPSCLGHGECTLRCLLRQRSLRARSHTRPQRGSSHRRTRVRLSNRTVSDLRTPPRHMGRYAHAESHHASGVTKPRHKVTLTKRRVTPDGHTS